MSIVRHVRRVVIHPVLTRGKRTGAATARTELFPRRLVLPETSGYVPTLSPADVARLLSANETSVSLPLPGSTAVRGFESNQLASNYPIEDRLAVARHRAEGLMYGVIDGHGGSACAQVLSERLLEYISAAVLPHSELEQCAHELREQPSQSALLHRHKFAHAYTVDRLSALLRASLMRFIDELLSIDEEDDDVDADDDDGLAASMREAFLRLDNDISTEALPSAGLFNMDTLQVAYSGACACVAHVSGRDLVVANVGDVRAVLGSVSVDGNWTATPLSSDQTAGNPIEVSRVCSAHPPSEAGSVLRHGRLLGQLVPLRAFGDVRFKWSRSDLTRLAAAMEEGSGVIPPRYYTPPYLTAQPVVQRHKLCAGDRFLVIATDGLWDNLSSERVVQIVGEYLEAGAVAGSYSAPHGLKLSHVNAALRQRKAGLARKIIDSNAATHLFRQGLGGQHAAVSQLLMLPPEIVRSYRDDISIVVVYFDQQYLCRDENGFCS